MTKARNLISLILLLGFSLAGCNTNQDPGFKPFDIGSDDEQTQESGGNEQQHEDKDMENSTVYERIWKTKTVHDEACVLIENDDGTISTNLLYTPTKILSVKNFTETRTYSEYEYEIVGNKIVRTASSTIPFLSKDNISCKTRPTGIAYYESSKVDSGKILYTEGYQLIAYQVHVTYEHEDTWGGYIPKQEGNRLPKLQEKLKNHQAINMVVYGDSIATGCNASSMYNIGPNLPKFDQGFANEVERLYGSKVNVTNTAVGGMMADWGRENIVENVINHNPDLVYIGFGMNDGCSAWRRSPDLFAEDIDFMVRAIQFNCPNAEIIIGATIVANKYSDQDYIQVNYLPLLQEIRDTYEGVALLDMTSFSKDLRDKKNSFELYANNINHPCDFLIRQTVAAMLTLIKK